MGFGRLGLCKRKFYLLGTRWLDYYGYCVLYFKLDDVGLFLEAWPSCSCLGPIFAIMIKFTLLHKVKFSFT